MNKLVMTALGVAAAALASVGQTTPESAPLIGDVASGRKLFVEKGCIHCHSVLGGGGDLGPSLARSGQGRTFYDLVSLLWGHSPKMIEAMTAEGIPRPAFTSREMADVIAYLYFLAYFDEPGDFLRGEREFAAKQCVRCHSVGGKGGEIGPRLDLYAQSPSPIKLAQALWNHGPAMARIMGSQNVERPRLESQDISDILAYLRGMGTASGTAPREYLVPGDPNRGRRIFEAKGCGSCHELTGEGLQGTGPDLGTSDLQRSVSGVAATLWNHGPVMWDKMRELEIEVPTLEPGEMSDLIAFLYFIRFFDRKGDPRAGEAVFRSKGCVGCHATEGTEGIGPDLASSKALESPPALAAALWNHAPQMLEKTHEVVVAWPTFESTEMRDLVAYLESLSKRH